MGTHREITLQITQSKGPSKKQLSVNVNYPAEKVWIEYDNQKISRASGALTIQNSWAHPASAGDNGAAYFVIENGAITNDTLLRISSDIATATEVHMSMGDGNGVMSMQIQESVPVPTKGQVEFKPGGLHVMYVNLMRDLKVGDTLTLG